jgi:hypothetical protein
MRIVVLMILVLTAQPFGQLFGGQKFSDFKTPLPIAPGNTLVIGIAGGWEAWNSDLRGAGKLASMLRAESRPTVHVEVVENHSFDLAVQLIEKAFDRNSDGVLAWDEALQAKLVIYGQSLGGAATVKLARECEKRQIPVQLAVMVDSVGFRDREIPPNVKRAANFYQREDRWPLNGEAKIIARDPLRTRILLNEKISYRSRFIPMIGERFLFRLFGRGHLLMEHDYELWSRIRTMIFNTVDGKIE